MNKQELEIAKKIAEIEGIELTKQISTAPETGEEAEWYSVSDASSLAEHEELYNPFSWSILGPLMVKYDVEPSYHNTKLIDIRICGGAGISAVTCKTKGEIPSAILECIIKSQGA